jgi:hypothetical protein
MPFDQEDVIKASNLDLACANIGMETGDNKLNERQVSMGPLSNG